MKYIDGIFNIIIGGILLLFPPVSNIDIQTVSIISRNIILEVEDNTFRAANEYHTLYTYSTPIMIVGALFVIYGIFKIWRAKHENSQQSN